MQVGTIIISHYLEAVKKCDKVLFIKNKTIMVGKHEELMRNDDLYRNVIEISDNKILEDEEF